MAVTYLEVIENVRASLGDEFAASWSEFAVFQMIAKAIRNSWPDFFTPVADETTYTGTNNVPGGTTEISVPAAFLASSANNLNTPNGAVWSVWGRDWDGSSASPVPAEWFPIRTDIRTDHTDYATPKIRFNDWWRGRPVEIRLYGGVPLTPPTYGIGSIAAITFTCSSLVSTMGKNPVALNDLVVFGQVPGNAAAVSRAVFPPGLARELVYKVASGGNPFSFTDIFGVNPTLTNNGIAYYAVVSDNCPGTNHPGFVIWLEAQVRAYLHQRNQRSNNYDREANLQRAILAQQEADQLRSRYRMERQYETLFNNFSGEI